MGDFDYETVIYRSGEALSWQPERLHAIVHCPEAFRPVRSVATSLIPAAGICIRKIILVFFRNIAVEQATRFQARINIFESTHFIHKHPSVYMASGQHFMVINTGSAQ